MIELEIVVACAPARAQELFLARVDGWWPANHRLDGGRLGFEDDVLVDRAGARSREVARVVERAPGRLVMDWLLGATPARPSRVTLGFTAVPGGTRVTVAHGRGAMTDAEWEGTNARFASGWRALLDGFRAIA